MRDDLHVGDVVCLSPPLLPPPTDVYPPADHCVSVRCVSVCCVSVRCVSAVCLSAAVCQVFAPWDGKPEPGVVTKLFKNGMVKIQWSDGTKATKVDATKIDASNAAAANRLLVLSRAPGQAIELTPRNPLRA